MQNYSIGFTRDDGDFQLLATLNDNDGAMTEGAVFEVAETLRDLIQKRLVEEHRHERVQLLMRQDAPDYIELEE